MLIPGQSVGQSATSSGVCERVAVRGGGPAGLVASRYLKAYGYEPWIFEQAADIGGQWFTKGANSSIWPSMRTNSSKTMTCFSDVEYPNRTPVFPHNTEVLSYLGQYADHFELRPHVRPLTRVLAITRAEKGWSLRLKRPCGESNELFDKVIIASGRHGAAFVPALSGLSSFSGSLGVLHSSQYKDPDRFRHARVLVLGGRVSALEIAADLAMSGAAIVAHSSRRRRYILQKLLGGVPVDNVVFNRFAARASARQVMEVLQQVLLQTTGVPEQYGAPTPVGSLSEAGMVICQHYLPFVAEGRISPKAWPQEINGRRIKFQDGSLEDYDGLLFGTGFTQDLSFFASGLREVLSPGGHLALYHHTFHPQAPGLAFVGFCPQTGPHFPVMELQARWIVYTWAGIRELPSTGLMMREISAAQVRPPAELPLHVAATLFSRLAGVEPEPARWPNLYSHLMFGPLTAASFRLEGPDSLDSAAASVARAGAMFGAIRCPTPTPEQEQMLAMLRARDLC